jgi:hypothetical protein
MYIAITSLIALIFGVLGFYFAKHIGFKSVENEKGKNQHEQKFNLQSGAVKNLKKEYEVPIITPLPMLKMKDYATPNFNSDRYKININILNSVKSPL